MEIDRSRKSIKIHNSGINTKSDRLSPFIRMDFFFLAILLSFFISSCSRSKLTQCEQIFRIASEVASSSKDTNYTNDGESSQIKRWLEAAIAMDKAANNIQALDVNDGKLIGYQNKLATIYRIYSQATYNAVKARESKNLEALELARIDAIKAGEMQQNLIKDINNYCLNK